MASRQGYLEGWLDCEVNPPLPSVVNEALLPAYRKRKAVTDRKRAELQQTAGDTPVELNEAQANESVLA